LSKDGGPAFPCDTFDPDVKGVDQWEGMSLRDWFATHAPEAPDWFVYTDPDVPAQLSPREALNQTTGYSMLSKDEQETLYRWVRDGDWDIDSNEAIGLAAKALLDTNKAERDKALRARNFNRYFAWRWFYARYMLKFRPSA
jgi:hypothetical protein